MVENEVLRNRIARVIAATRFPFIDQEDWGEGFITIVNDEIKVRGIETDEGIIYPSIVILRSDREIQEIGEVEMEDGVKVENVPKWRLFSENTKVSRFVKKFFLYVPKGFEEKAMKLLENNNIEYAGLRSWEIIKGNLSLMLVKSNDGPHDHR